jgi:flagellar protein FliO/FliZ
MCRRCLLFLGTALFTLPVCAAEQAEKAAVPHLPGATLGTGALIQTVLVLLLIVGMIFGLAWVVRRTGYAAGAGKGMVKVLGGVSLGPRERAMILQAGDTRLLVGVAPGRVQTLCLLPPATGGDAESQEGKPFSSQLDAALEEAESDGG